MTYTIQVSNHPLAGERIPTKAASESWQTIYDGPIASAREARAAVYAASNIYRHARVFKGGTLGRLYYSVLRMQATYSTVTNSGDIE